MADERDTSHDPIPGHGAQDADQAHREGSASATASATDMPYPATEVAYWREIYVSEPYYLANRSFEDYLPAYQLGWASFGVHGDDLEIADRLMANDWSL